ncbi:MAG TPA: hypothetical protein VKH43_11835 [Thermoanaerobaculia bacterium]|nr:hypothetical protein [Thermoanaerobaculia bacterium]
MVLRVLLSALHVLALAIGFAALFARGRRLRDLARRREDTGALARLFQAAGANLSRLIALNDAEVAVILVIPFVAALMARGAWLF